MRRLTTASLFALAALLPAAARAQQACTPPNVLLVMDRSGSMKNTLADGARKWDVAVAAISDLALTLSDRVQFGVGLFPGDASGCEPGALTLPVAPSQGTAVAELLSTTDFRSSTPIAASIAAIAAAEPSLADATRPEFVVVVTDGKENCDGDTVGAVTALRARTPEVRTFVVGFGAEVDPDELNAMADAGGTARIGATRYFQADDAASLDAALAEIATQVTGGDPEFSTCAAVGAGGDGGGGAGAGEGGGDGSGGPGGVGDGDGSAGGCACDAGGAGRGAPAPALLALLGLVGVVVARRRRRA